MLKTPFEENSRFFKKIHVIHNRLYYIYSDTDFVNSLIVVFNKIYLSKEHIDMDGEELKAALGQNIKNLRTHRQYSQAELAEKADISIIYLSNIERGKKYPKPAILTQIAEGLDVEIYELFKSNHVPMTQNVNKKYINRISQDITQKVIQALETGFKKYIK
jgi:transcriptional regulator with XRE-family HTH domain